MYLDSTTRSIEILLGGSITTNQLPVVCSWVDHTATTVTPGTTRSLSNNTTAVTAVAAPAASTQRQVQTINVYNNDTVAATVTVRLNDNSTTAILMKATLQIGETLHYEARYGWQILEASNSLPAGGTANQVLVKQSSTKYDTAFASVGTNSLASNCVTPAKMATMTAGRVLGRRSGISTGSPEELTPFGSIEISGNNINLVGDVTTPSDRSVYAENPYNFDREWVPFEDFNDLIKTAPIGLTIDIATTSQKNIFSMSGFRITNNDQFIFEAFILLQNNSGAAKTYTFYSTLADNADSITVTHANGTTIATSAIARTMLYVKSIASTTQITARAFLITDHAAVSAANTGANIALAFSRKSWDGGAMNLTTTNAGSFSFAISSSAANLTQEVILLDCSLRRLRSL